MARVRIVSLPPLMSCPACRAADGTEIPLETALKEHPLPHADCTNSAEDFCCCSYAPLFSDEMD